MGKRVIGVVIAACGVLAALLTGCGAPGAGAGASPAATKSLASSGGYRITLQAACLPNQPGCDLTAATSAAIKMLVGRAAALGVMDPSGHVSGNAGSHEITLDLPGAAFTRALKSALVTIGRVELIDSGGQYLPSGSSVAGKTCTTTCQPDLYKILFTSSQFDPASIRATTDRQAGQPVVTFAFAGSAKQAFATYTRQSIGQYLTVTLDDTIIESATIQSEIDGEGEITGITSTDQARDLVAYMTYGPLPATLSIENIQHIAPSS